MRTEKAADTRNSVLIAAGVLSISASILHVSIIVGGAGWYRFFGAGEELAMMAEQGSWYPGFITFAIAVVLFIWGLYAFSGAGMIRRLPFLKVALVIISMIYLVRGLAILPVYFIQPDIADAFLVWSSVICTVYGLLYAVGSWQVRDCLVVTG